MEAASLLGYRPNALARSLIVQRTNLIGLVMVEWENPFYTTMLRQFSERFQAEGFQLMLLTSHSEADVDEAVRQLLQYQVDGMLVVSAKPSPELTAECRRSETPLVLINRHAAGRPASSVTCDNAQVGRDIVQLLVKAGYQHFAMVRGDPAVQAGLERTRAIESMVAGSKTASIVADVTGCLGYEAGRREIARLWQQPVRPDAVICSSDPTALGVLDGARYDLGINIADELAVIGVGDIPQASWGAYRLTTVHLPIDEMIDLAVRDLLDHLEDPDLPVQPLQVKGRIIERDTVRPAKP